MEGLRRQSSLPGQPASILADAGSDLGAAPQSPSPTRLPARYFAHRGLPTDARREFERALRIRRSQSGISPWATVEIQIRLASVLAGTGDRPGAVALLEEARLLLASAPDGADALLARLDRLERRLAAAPRGVLVVDPLTDREVGVLRLLRGSMSIREIGETLNVSQNTVKTHTSAIYRKLGVSSRHDAIRRGRDMDIL